MQPALPIEQYFSTLVIRVKESFFSNAELEALTVSIAECVSHSGYEFDLSITASRRSDTSWNFLEPATSINTPLSMKL